MRSLDDVYGWEQTRSQGLLLEVEHPAYGAPHAPGLAAALRRPGLPRWPPLGTSRRPCWSARAEIRAWLDRDG
ncbi:MAG: hypothetical protein R2731_11780 [Nocardioides sp.]